MKTLYDDRDVKATENIRSRCTAWSEAYLNESAYFMNECLEILEKWSKTGHYDWDDLNRLAALVPVIDIFEEMSPEELLLRPSDPIFPKTEDEF